MHPGSGGIEGVPQQRKILILDTGKEWGGGTNSLIELLKRIETKRWRFTVMFYNNYGKGEESDVRKEILKTGADFRLVRHGGRYSRLAKILRESVRIILFFSRKVRKRSLFLIDYYFRIMPDARSIASVIKEMDADLLYMNNQPSSNLEGILAARITGVPVIQHSRISSELNHFEVNIVNRRIEKMICVSNGVRSSFVSQGVKASICEVVHNGIDCGVEVGEAITSVRAGLGFKEDDIVIGTVGSLIKRKRVMDLIRAFLILSDESGLSVKLLIVGEGAERNNLENEVMRDGLSESVRFTGFCPAPLSYINAMDIFVMTSEKEGLPRVILEAMVLRKPVVAYDIAGVNELVIDGVTGFLSANGAHELLASNILKLVCSAKKRTLLGERGLERIINNFTIEKYVDGVAAIIKDTLEKKGDILAMRESRLH